MAAVMSCTSLSVYYCIFLNFAFGGRSTALVMDHGTMFYACSASCLDRQEQLGCHGGWGIGGGRSVCVVLSQALHLHNLW